ncbi:hypothetical protein BHE74_00012500 [Ensete ventricosum]|nr:hypothetical protein BHE74_00012500 [Ensete ventricosum]
MIVSTLDDARASPRARPAAPPLLDSDSVPVPIAFFLLRRGASSERNRRPGYEKEYRIELSRRGCSGVWFSPLQCLDYYCGVYYLGERGTGEG